MTFALDLTEEQSAIKHAVEEICAKYDDHYWLNVDNTGDFPDAFVNDIAAGGWLGVAMPERVGGAGPRTSRGRRCAGILPRPGQRTPSGAGSWVWRRSRAICR